MKRETAILDRTFDSLGNVYAVFRGGSGLNAWLFVAVIGRKRRAIA